MSNGYRNNSTGLFSTPATLGPTTPGTVNNVQACSCTPINLCVTGGPILTAGIFCFCNLAVEITGSGTCSTYRMCVNNVASGNCSASLGGTYNCAVGNFSFVGGGCGNVSSTPYDTITGGFLNSASGGYSTISGGYKNSASGYASAILGGFQNFAIGVTSGVVSGSGNYSCGGNSFIGGGGGNIVYCELSSIVSGTQNLVCSQASFLGSGVRNCIQINSDRSAIGGGDNNTISSKYSFIGGGKLNTISTYSEYSTISGGYKNCTLSNINTISGGYKNCTDCNYTTIGGGARNCALCDRGVISGGIKNCILAIDSTISGGYCNVIKALNYTLGVTLGEIGNVISGGAKNLINPNTVSGAYFIGGVVIGGGYCNTTYTTKQGGNVISGGRCNIVCNDFTFIGGGCCNTSSGYGSGILGGFSNNTCGYACSFIVGTNICANSACTTFFNNLNIVNTPTQCATQDQILVRNSSTGLVNYRTANSIASATYYGSFYDTSIQTIAANVATPMKLNSCDTNILNGFTIANNLSGNPTRITATNTGKYNLMFSAQLDRTSGGAVETVDVWININGNPVANTNTHVSFAGNANYVVAAWNFFFSLNATDYVELYWASTSNTIRLLAEAASAIHPATPSLIATINQV